MMDFFTGKLQDLGLKFSHETPKVAAGGLAYKKEIFLLNFIYAKHHSIHLNDRIFYISILLQLDMNRFQYDFLTL